MSELTALLVSRIRQHGPLTVADFMEAALYDPVLGYYARAARRSGRGGDFFTSVDVGPLFGELIAVQLDELVDVVIGKPAEQQALGLEEHVHFDEF